MHILLVNKFFWRKGGSETAYFNEKELLERYGNVVVPFSMKHQNNEYSPYDKYFIEYVDYSSERITDKISSAVKIIYSLESRSRIKALLAHELVQIAHFHIFQHQISPSVFGPLRKRRIPIVLTLHDLKPICPNYKMLTHDGICERCRGRRFYNCMLHRCSKESALKSTVSMIEMYFHYAMGYYRHVDKYIAVSSFYRNKMIEYGFPSKQIVHIPNAIDPSRYSYSESDRGYGIYFGRLSEEKGLLTLLKALKICPEIPFIIVGHGPQERSLRMTAESYNLRNVTFTGFKIGEELKKLLNESSFMVIPSEWYENCPMSVLEAFATGKPVIGARIGGIPELVREGIDGMTFLSGNSEDLAEKILQLWSSSSKRRTMGKNGREKILTEYTQDKHYEQIMSVYNEVLHK